MKLAKIFALVTVVLLAVPQLAGTLQSAPRTAAEMVNAGLKRHSVEQGTIEFELHGDLEGTQHVSFDHWGWREASIIEGTSQRPDGEHETKRMEVLDGELIAMADLIQAKGNRTSSLRNSHRMAEKGSNCLAEMDEAALQEGTVQLGKEKILGRECTIYEMPERGLKIWFWKGLILKNETVTNGHLNTIEAVKLDTKSPVDPAVFEFPAYVKLLDLGPIPGQ